MKTMNDSSTLLKSKSRQTRLFHVLGDGLKYVVICARKSIYPIHSTLRGARIRPSIFMTPYLYPHIPYALRAPPHALTHHLQT